MLVFRGIDVAPESIGCCPELGLVLANVGGGALGR